VSRRTPGEGSEVEVHVGVGYWGMDACARVRVHGCVCGVCVSYCTPVTVWSNLLTRGTVCQAQAASPGGSPDSGRLNSPDGLM
jgi:hypothetical protein